MNSPPMDRVLSRLHNVKPNGDGYTAKCPAHEDQNSSLSMGEGEDGRALLKCHAGCEVQDIVKAMGLKMADLFTSRSKQGKGGPSSSPSTPATPQQSAIPQSTDREQATEDPRDAGGGCSLEQYERLKQLPLSFLKELGLTQFWYIGHPAVRMPYRDADGNEVAARFRIAPYKTRMGDNRFRWRKGSKPCLYGLWLLQMARNAAHVVLVEGESDAQTLWLHGIPALGLPGASTFKEEWAEFFEGIGIIYVIVEPDKGGETVVNRLAKSSIRDRVRLVRLGEDKDPSALHLRCPDQFNEILFTALDDAVALTEIKEAEEAVDVQEAWEQCKHIALRTDILEHLANVAESRGVAGEKRIIKLLFLGVASRFLPRPIAIAVKGPSSGGKSYIVEQVLRFFPEVAYLALSAMSERALIYSEEPLSHRILVVYEAAGTAGDFLDYLIRSLLSEGHISYETVEKTGEGLRARTILRPGPTGFITTTTAISLHPENETRILSVTVTDTPEQTRRIFSVIANKAADADEESEENQLQDWHAYHYWLSYVEHRVTVPYSRQLASRVPPLSVRLRRDFNMILKLIQVHAILHQATRERDAQGRIIATIEDYGAVRELLADLVAEGVEATVSKQTRETLNAVREICQEAGNSEATVSVVQLARRLKIDKSAASRRVKVCLQRGYLRNLEGTKGSAFKLQIGDALPEDQQILPLPEELIIPLDAQDAGCCTVESVSGQIPIPPPPAEDEPQDMPTYP